MLSKSLFCVIVSWLFAVAVGEDALPCLSSRNEISFETSKLIQNDLNGRKNDPGAMRFQGVGEIDGKQIDLVVTLKEGQGKRDVEGNGFKGPCDKKGRNCLTGDLGTINSDPKEDTTFLYKFVDSEDNPVVVSAFHFSVFDIDQEKTCTKEEYKISGYFTAVYDSEDLEANFAETSSTNSNGTGEKSLIAKSTKLGKGCDNPKNVNDLGDFNCEKNSGNKALRSFAVLFKDKSEFELKFKTPCSRKKGKRGKKCNCNGGGRNFLFGFRSGMDCPDIEIPPCLEEIQDELSLRGSTLIQSNLDGHNLDGVIRYGNVGTVENDSIDLEVTVKDGFEYDIDETKSVNGFRCEKELENELKKNCTSDFGTISLVANRSTALRFRLLDSKTNEPKAPKGFYFTLFDIDKGPSRVGEDYEVTGFDTAVYDKKSTEVNFKLCSTPNENCLRAESKNIGKECDNPIDLISFEGTCNDADQITKEQVQQRSFMLGFENKSEFEVKFETPSADGELGGGRNMLFAFRSSLGNCPMKECDKNVPVSVCIALDRSGSVCNSKTNCDNWNVHTKGFTKKLIEELGITVTDSDFSIISFASDIIVETKKLVPAINAVKVVEDLEREVSGYTNTQGAIKKCRNELENASDDRLKFMFLLTDGNPTVDKKGKEENPNCDSCRNDATDEALISKNADIEIVTVGIESDVFNCELLDELASEPGLSFLVNRFDNLDEYIKVIADKANVCEESIM